MKTLDEAESYLKSQNIPDSKIIKCGLYINSIIKELCKVYVIEYERSEIKDASRKLTRVLFNQFISYEEKLDQKIEEQIDNVLDEFKQGGKKAIGNILPVLNQATQNEDTTNKIIDEISLRFFPEDFDIFEKPDDV